MVEIATAELADAQEILALQKLAYAAEARLYNDWSLPALTQSIDSLRQEFAGSIILKALVNKEIVGSVRSHIDGGVCKIGRLFVHPRLQGRGIGTALLLRIEQLQSDIGEFELFTGSKSVANIRLYERQGYVKSQEKILSQNVCLIYMIKSVKNRQHNY